MNVLVACEESQEVCKAFREKGHEAYSCDIQECSGGHPEWHIKGNCLPLIRMGGTRFQTENGDWHTAPEEWGWAAKAYGRYMDRVEGIKFFMEFICCNAKKIAIENPVGIMSGVYRKPDQIIQPYEYGHHARKATCLWLRNLPLLMPTDVVDPGVIDRTGHSLGAASMYALDENGKILSWNDPRTAKIRSKTFPGIAKAMAEQWG